MCADYVNVNYSTFPKAHTCSSSTAIGSSVCAAEAAGAAFDFFFALPVVLFDFFGFPIDNFPSQSGGRRPLK